MGGSFHSRGESWHSNMSLQVLKSFKTVTEEKENCQSVFLPDKLLHCCDQRGKKPGIAATDAAKARAFRNKVLLITYWGSRTQGHNLWLLGIPWKRPVTIGRMWQPVLNLMNNRTREWWAGVVRTLLTGQSGFENQLKYVQAIAPEEGQDLGSSERPKYGCDILSWANFWTQSLSSLGK